MNGFIHSDSLFEREDERTNDKMLCEKFFESLGEKNNVFKLKKFADSTLYLSGFFASSLNNKLVNQSYYIQVGAVVYSSLSSMVDSEAKAGIYRHISKHFIKYADVLTEVSEKTNIQKSGNVLELFDRYLDTGSKWAERLLIENGIPLSPLKKTSN